MSDSPEEPPRTDADERPAVAGAEPVTSAADEVDRAREPVVPLRVEAPDRAEDLRSVDDDGGDDWDDDWPHGERQTEDLGLGDDAEDLRYDDADEDDDPYAPGLGVLGIGDPAEPNEPA